MITDLNKIYAYTVDSGQFAYLRAFWRLSQIKPGDKFRHAEEKETRGGGGEPL